MTVARLFGNSGGVGSKATSVMVRSSGELGHGLEASKRRRRERDAGLLVTRLTAERWIRRRRRGGASTVMAGARTGDAWTFFSSQSVSFISADSSFSFICRIGDAEWWDCSSLAEVRLVMMSWAQSG